MPLERAVSRSLFLIQLFTRRQNLRPVQIQMQMTKKKKCDQKLKFVLGRLENTVGKRENAGYQHFLLFPQCFQKASIPGSLKVGIVWYRVNWYNLRPLPSKSYTTRNNC